MLLFTLGLLVSQSVESSSDSTTCFFIEQNNNKITEPISSLDDTCILQSNITIEFSSSSFNRSFLTSHCNERCGGETDSVALVSFLEDEIGPYLSCNDGPIRACDDPYLMFNNHSSALLLYQPLYHRLPFVSSFLTNSNSIGSYEECAYGTNEATFLFEQYDKNCSMTSLSWLCLCSHNNN